ncbi:hypothetical protein ALC62_07616 [Cyphomyrmex costatus]|uniref:Uncharacterized protein n=1 Tax=Cyphomyrmex costatus TaxID=456900 RepID=A0A195CNH9_9HYME|nr:hypothetical protein ALC62_07616 [Cyphomyrmex costatus]
MIPSRGIETFSAKRTRGRRKNAREIKRGRDFVGWQSRRPIVGGECRCAPRSRPVIVATRRRPYGRRRRAVMLGLVRALRIEIQNGSLSLSLLFDATTT